MVYKIILENGDKKWEAGKKLASINDYGGATSMAIISVEEMVKALVVYLDGKGFEFRSVKGMETVFKQHQIRYLIAYVMFVIGLFGDEVFKFLRNVRENPSEIIRVKEALKLNKEEFFEKNVKRYLFKKIILLKNEFKWFSQVDIFRQDGFYCDYEDQLKSPITISSFEYEEVFRRLDRVREVGNEIIAAFENQDELTSEEFKELKKDFKRDKYYIHIEKSLATVRQSRESPFDIIKRLFPYF